MNSLRFQTKTRWLVTIILLLSLGICNTWGSEITILATDMATNNGYFTSEQTITKTVQFGYIYAYQSNANNTPTGWAKNQAMVLKGHASQNGKIYNKAAISTISNIRVYLVANTNSFTLSYGTTTACSSGSITRPASATGTESITYTSYNSDSKTTTPGQTTTASYYDFDVSAASPTFFKIANGSNQLFIWKIVITYSSGTSVSLTNGGCDGSGGTTKGSFTMSTSSVTTTSSSGSVTLTCTPANGYQTSSVSATDPATHPGSITYGGSGNSRTVTYPTGHNGSSTITVNFTCVTPTITVHPASKTDYTVGDVATALSVTASANNASLGYQWQVSNNNSDWSDIAAGDGGTAETYTPSTAAAGTKYYRVIVSNAATGCSTTATSNAATITVAAAAYFPNSKTLFIEAGKDGSAWDASACVKAWFRDGDAGGEVVATQWLANAGDGKKIFATVIPSSGSYRYMTIQRFTEGCGSFWNDNGAVSKVDDGGSNVVKTTCSTNTCVSWSPSALSLYLRGNINNWEGNLATLSDQNAGIWTASYNNYTATATSRDFRITDSYDNMHGTGNTTLDGMIVGSTYDIAASYDVTSGTLEMSKTFVKGTVHFNLQGHGSAISDIENVTAGSKISAPSTPTDASYIFGGWYKEAGCVNAWDFANDVVNESMTLYAKWYQVTLVVNDEAGTTLSGDGKPTLTRSGASLTAAEAGNYAFKTIAITSGTGTLSAVSSSTTIATISSDITVTATFWNARTVTKGTGTGTGTFTISPTGEVKYGSSVTVTCAATDGYKNPWTLTVTPSDGATYDETGSTGSITISNITKNITVDLAYTDKGCTTHKGNGVDEGSSYSNVYGPVNDNWNYGARQILYTKSDLGLAAGKKGTIKSISFQYQYSTSISDKDKVKIYMANTNLTSLSTSNYVTSFTEVYSGSMNCSNGWNEIELDTDFDYNGVGNLLVVIEDYSGKYTGSSYAFYYHEATTGIQLYNTTDGSAYDITAASTWTSGTAVAYRPNTKFCIEEDDMVKYTVTWHVGESTSTTSNVYEGTTFSTLEASAPAHPDNALAACGSTKFIGWVKASGEYTEDGKTADWYNTHKYAAADEITSDVDIYAMYAEGSGGGSTTKSYGWEASESDASSWTISGPSQSSNQHNNGSYSGYINTNNTYVTFNEKVNVTEFSFYFTRTSDNNNYNVYIETSANGSDWSAAATFAMSSFATSVNWKKCSKTWDGETAYYVRFHCSNTTAVRYVDDVSITYGSTSYSNYRTGCTVSCGAPVLNAASSITAYGATISWTDEGKAGTLDHYEYAVWADGEDEPTSGFVDNGTTKNKALTGLLSNTDYNYKVRRVCTGDDNSRWSSGSFTTGNISLTFSVPTGASAVAGQNSNVALPSAEVPTDCGDCWAFVGWTTAAYAENSSAPAKLFAAGDVVHLAAADGSTMYAVYVQNTFKQISSTSELVANDNYVLTFINTNEYALSNEKTYTHDAAVTNVTSLKRVVNGENFLYTVGANNIYKFTGTYSSGQLYNVAADKYVNLSSTSEDLLRTTDDLAFAVNADNKKWTISSTNYLKPYGTTSFEINSSSIDAYAYIYRQNSISYATSPDCPKYTVTWDINNGATTSTTDVTKCEGYLSALPSAPADNTLSGCQTNGKFMGWSANKVMPAQDVAPADLFSAKKDAPKITENVTFYAVFANGVAGAETPVNTTYTFNSKSWGDATNSWSSNTAGDELTSGRGIKILGSASAEGITKNSYTDVTKVVVTYCTNASSGTGSITVTVGDTEFGTNSISKPSSGGATLKTFTYTHAAATGKVKISASASTNSIYIYSVQIYYTGAGTVYEQYRTACCNDPGFSFTDENDAPVTEYVIVREDLASASDAVEIDCNYTSANTEGAITWYSTRRAALGFPATGAYTWTTRSSQPAGLNIDIANKKISASATGVWTITISQADGGTTYCPVDAVVTVRVKTVDKFVDAVNGNFGGDAQRREDTGDGITLPTEAEFSIDDGCSTERRLLGWVKESDLSGYTSGYIDSWKTNDASNKVIAPGTKVSATGITWYAVWGTEKDI